MPTSRCRGEVATVLAITALLVMLPIRADAQQQTATCTTQLALEVQDLRFFDEVRLAAEAGAAAATTLSSLYSLGGGTAAIIGSAVSEVALPLAGAAAAGYTAYLFYQGSNEYLDLHSHDCDAVR